MDKPAQKHDCPDCHYCQWCSDDRCRLCLRTACCGRPKLSLAEQIALYERLNQQASSDSEADADAPPSN